MARPDFGWHEIEVEGHNKGPVKLTCRYIAPGLTLHDLMGIFHAAHATGNNFAGNPGEWPDIKGVNAVLDAVFAAIYGPDEKKEEPDGNV